jgi:endonuclease/exonuclease/phosphatase (EEP) superfamily protein YafD
MVRLHHPCPRQASRVLWIRLVVALALLAAIPFSNLTVLALTGSDDASPQSSTTEIVVMTANLGDGLSEPAQLVSFIREHDVDIVALQEVTPDMAEALAADLGDLFPYQEVRGLGIPGKALLSRYPITQVEWLETNPGRPDLFATVDLAGQPIELLVAHPTPPGFSGGLVRPREGSVEQFDRLAEIAANAESPFLMLGDFNMIPLHQRYFELKSIGLQDIFAAVGSGVGFTYPERIPPLPDGLVHPFMRIDYIWASEDWHALSATVGDDIGSDHLPVIARLELAGAAGT